MESNKEKITKASVKENAEVVKVKAKEKRIYIGPNMLQLTTYTVIENEYPVHIKDLVSKCPDIDKLFVSVDSLVEAEKRAKTKGTLEYRYYTNIVEFNSKRGE